MSTNKAGPLLILCLTSPGVTSADPPSQLRERFVCSFGGAQRLIDIYRLDADGGRTGACRVEYTRDGATRQIWSAHGDYAYCVKQAVTLVTKLSRGSFSCKPEAAEQPRPTASP